jgi:hypothetical protein
VRAGICVFSELERACVERRIAAREADLESGAWGQWRSARGSLRW